MEISCFRYASNENQMQFAHNFQTKWSFERDDDFVLICVPELLYAIHASHELAHTSILIRTKIVYAKSFYTIEISLMELFHCARSGMDGTDFPGFREGTSIVGKTFRGRFYERNRHSLACISFN